MKRWLLWGVALLFLLGVGAVAWLGVSARTVAAELTAAKNELIQAKDSIDQRDVLMATGAIASAAEHASIAEAQTAQPVWGLAAAVPRLGDTPEAVRTISVALDQALESMTPAVDDALTLSPASIITDDGGIDGTAISEAMPSLRAAAEGVTAAATTLATAPAAVDGDLVLAQVEQARITLGLQLAQLDDTFRSIVNFGDIGLPMLGVGEPKRYFVGITNPNEARGTGGFLGTWAIIRADEGEITVEEIGSNEDLPSFDTLPVDLGEDFEARYGDAAGAVGNMNLSPHFPNAAQLWLASWKERTGQDLDGAIAADVIALGSLIDAGGGRVDLPDGGSVTGEELARLATFGIYEKFPGGDFEARSAYQEAVAASAVEVAFAGLRDRPLAVADALGEAISQGRVLAWVADTSLQDKVIGTPLGGSLAVADGPAVELVMLNSSASKLDTFLARSVRYAAGRCVDDAGLVRSTLTVTLENAIPEGLALPEYVVAQAEVGPDGPVNTTQAQVHLPNGSQVVDVQLDGQPAAYTPFLEQGRPSLVVGLDLEPRAPRTMTVVFQEPWKADADPVVAEQPLVVPQQTEVVPAGC